jgi:uncharacterized protein YbjT (DUF2867 family)
MPAETKKIAVIGATGAQGGGVVAALAQRDGFDARALTRDPTRAAGLAPEVVGADLTKPDSVRAAFEGAYGVFANTNSFGGPDVDEVAQVTVAVEAAKEAGIEHFVWSTLPNVEAISDGRFDVPHFTNKAKANEVVTAAGFRWFTFVEPPFYLQNLTSPMYAPHPGADGTPTWAQPMREDSRTMHVGDISELGNLVVGALESPDAVGGGQHLALAGDLVSWADIVSTLRGQGHQIAFVQAPAAQWDQSFPGAEHIRYMFEYFEAYTYFGPDAQAKLDLAAKTNIRPATNFATWARANMADGF